MIVISALIAATVLQGAQGGTSDYTADHLRPSKIVAKVASHPGTRCKLQALDKEGKIRITGSDDDRREMLHWLEVFDVQPLAVNLSVHVFSRIDKTEYKLDLAVANNETFTFTETTTGCRVSLSPRVNADGTVTLNERFAVGDTAVQAVVRCTQGQYVTLLNAGKGTPYTVANSLVVPKDLVPVLVVSPTVRTAGEPAKADARWPPRSARRVWECAASAALSCPARRRRSICASSRLILASSPRAGARQEGPRTASGYNGGMAPGTVRLVSIMLAALNVAPAAGVVAEGARWSIGAPITTYFAGPPLTDKTATQMRDGGFNLVWTKENELDTAKSHGLRAMLHDPLLVPASLDDPTQLAKLDALITRVAKHPALYAYFLTDEPSATAFAGWGKLVAHLRAKDPGHLAYINLFPTYANNEQLGTAGDTVTAYREHLRQFVATVKPDLLSYDHYHFAVGGDRDQYFLNLAMIRRAAMEAGIPFLNIVQACTWDSSMRAPNANELRWLYSTSLAYGAQGVSVFVYFYEPFFNQFKDKAGQMMRPDGLTTPLYDAAKVLNPEFVAVATQLQPLRSLLAYHVGSVPLGALGPTDKSGPFHFDDAVTSLPAAGLLVGLFGKGSKPTHAYVVNLDYRNAVTATLVGPGRLQTFDAVSHQWKPASAMRAALSLPPGGGVLVRVR